MSSIQENVASIKNKISDFEKKYGRTSGSVQLLAASKGQPLERIEEAIAAGQTCFGENYVQEALDKMEALGEKNKNLEWHFIGKIQTNKIKKIAEHFSWAHSVCDKKMAERLNDHRDEKLPPLNVCIEINVSHEATKTGIDENKVEALAKYCLTLPRLRLRGLMTIPAPQKNLTDQRAAFHKLQTLMHTLRARGIPLDTLSMGMSDDMEAAIAEGATIVRIGTALLGQRTKIKANDQRIEL